MQNLVSSRKCRFDSDHPHHCQRYVKITNILWHRYECDVPNLAKVGVEGSNPFARSKIPLNYKKLQLPRAGVAFPLVARNQDGTSWGGTKTGSDQGGIWEQALRRHERVCSIGFGNLPFTLAMLLFRPRSLTAANVY
jgi:hypothetical protein